MTARVEWVLARALSVAWYPSRGAVLMGALCLREPAPHLTFLLWCVDGDARNIT
jgi:hypothetical protein